MGSGFDRITKVIRHHWDERANTFDDEPDHGLFSDEQRQAWLDLFARLAGPVPQHVLDVGCGTGFLTLMLAELGHEVTGIDLSPQMIDRARRKAEQASLQIDFRIGNAVAIDCADETYELVVARHLIWTLPDPQRGVAEWLRVLRPGGRLILIEGKWADNEALALSYARPAARLIARLMDAVAAGLPRSGAGLARSLLDKRYPGVEVQLPFSGGPTANRLASFLEANHVQDVVVEPLMDPTLWGGQSQFPRYAATGIRSSDPALVDCASGGSHRRALPA
jgi:ubiquinone/menaquinone biosynthesis C-methylase UbiE